MRKFGTKATKGKMGTTTRAQARQKTVEVRKTATLNTYRNAGLRVGLSKVEAGAVADAIIGKKPTIINKQALKSVKAVVAARRKLVVNKYKNSRKLNKTVARAKTRIGRK